MQIKQCKNCNQPFTVTDTDEAFYKTLSPTFAGKLYLIPSPTFCPSCRAIRRLAYRNENKLYRRKSDFSGKEMISVFRPDSPYKIYTRDEWWSDKWDALNCAQNPNPNTNPDPDLDKLFFDQFASLQLKVPRPPLINNKAENSEYCNFADGNKNCYMVTSANRNEDCYYGFLLVENTSCIDCLWCTNSELCYECVDCRHCYNTDHAQDCENCVDSAYLYNCRGLNNCLLCVNLNNVRYHIKNRPYERNEYFKAVKAAKADPTLAAMEFEKVKQEFNIRKSATLISCDACIGNNIFHSKNIHEGFDVYDSEDSAYLHDGLKATDCQDICFFDGTELCYESTSLIGYGYRFTNFCRDSYNLFYCDNCHSCKNCFGCIGLKRKEYCVLNKQYEQNEYEKTCAALIDHMIKTGEWGEFFPVNKSLFPLEDTLAVD